MENPTTQKAYVDRKVWFSMWFLGAVVTFGIAFFPMFYRLVEGRNGHLKKEAEVEQQLAATLKVKGKVQPLGDRKFKAMNSKFWAASIILIVPVFVLVYLLSKDLEIHEHDQDAFLLAVLPERTFMPQTIQIRTYAIVTLATLGVGVIYWLYKVVNLYNAHYKAHVTVEKELVKVLGDQKAVEQL